MTSNSAQMTFEEKVVQHIKEQSISVLMDDEQALTDLTRRAVNEALFKDRPDGSYSRKEAPVHEFAREIAKRLFEKMIDKEVKRMEKDPEVMAIMRQSIALMMPEVLKTGAHNLFGSIIQQSNMETVQLLKQAGIVDPNRHI